jgi:putative DNA primase/helicase
MPDIERPGSHHAQVTVPPQQDYRAMLDEMARADTLPDMTGVECTEISIAEWFAMTYRDMLQWHTHRRRWMIWSGSRWTVDERFDATRLLARALHGLAIENPRKREKLLQRRTCEMILRHAAEMMVTTADDWDQRDDLLGLPSGYVDLTTGAVHPPDPTLRISLAASVMPAATADCPKWIEFLLWATNGDADLVRYLQKFFGYCATGFMNEEILTFFYGPGMNGKGTIRMVISEILGEYHRATPTTTFMSSKGNEHTTELARLNGMRFVTASETNENDTWNAARIKEVTGFETKIAARFMRQDYFEYWPRFKLLVVGNQKPRIETVDTAIKRRMRLVDFMQIAEEKDTNLKASFKPEYPAILRWIIEGAVAWSKEGLEQVSAVSGASVKYLKSEDVVSEIIADCLEFRPGGILLRRDVKPLIEAFRRATGTDKRVSAQALGKALREVHLCDDGKWHRNMKAWGGVNINERGWEYLREHYRRIGTDLPTNDDAIGYRFEDEDRHLQVRQLGREDNS